jgi:hypothetical protein
MTSAEHAKEVSRLKAAITRAKTSMRKQGSLADKIAARAKIEIVEEALRQHKLNYYELVR